MRDPQGRIELNPETGRGRYEVPLEVVAALLSARPVMDVPTQVSVAVVHVGAGIITDEVMPQEVDPEWRRAPCMRVDLFEHGEHHQVLFQLVEPPHGPRELPTRREEDGPRAVALEHVRVGLECEGFRDFDACIHWDLLGLQVDLDLKYSVRYIK